MDKTALAKMISKLIKEKGMLIRAIAKATGVPASTLSQMANGRDSYRIEHLLKLSKFFSVSLEFLITGEDARPPTVGEAFLEEVFNGYLKVKVERVIPNKRRIEIEDGEDQ